MMKSKVVAPVILTLVLGVLMLGLSACGSKENEPVKGPAPSGAPQASQPATPAAPASSAPDAEAAAAPPVQAKINAAEYFTKADAEAVLGKSVSDPGVQGNGVTNSNVNYVATDFSAVSLYVNAGATAQSFDQAQAASKSISGVDPVPVAGLGEKAYWAAGKLNQLNILKHSNLLIITVMNRGDKSLDLARQAAERILPRVP
jgi:hypothetical protein